MDSGIDFRLPIVDFRSISKIPNLKLGRHESWLEVVPYHITQWGNFLLVCVEFE